MTGDRGWNEYIYIYLVPTQNRSSFYTTSLNNLNEVLWLNSVSPFFPTRSAFRVLGFGAASGSVGSLNQKRSGKAWFDNLKKIASCHFEMKTFKRGDRKDLCVVYQVQSSSYLQSSTLTYLLYTYWILLAWWHVYSFMFVLHWLATKIPIPGSLLSWVQQLDMGALKLGNYGPGVSKMYTIYRIAFSVFKEKWLILIIKLSSCKRQWNMELRKHPLFVKPVASQNWTVIPKTLQSLKPMLPKSKWIFLTSPIVPDTSPPFQLWEPPLPAGCWNWIINENTEPNDDPKTTSAVPLVFLPACPPVGIFDIETRTAIKPWTMALRSSFGIHFTGQAEDLSLYIPVFYPSVSLSLSVSISIQLSTTISSFQSIVSNNICTYDVWRI